MSSNKPLTPKQEQMLAEVKKRSPSWPKLEPGDRNRRTLPLDKIFPEPGEKAEFPSNEELQERFPDLNSPREKPALASQSQLLEMRNSAKKRLQRELEQQRDKQPHRGPKKTTRD